MRKETNTSNSAIAILEWNTGNNTFVEVTQATPFEQIQSDQQESYFANFVPNTPIAVKRRRLEHYAILSKPIDRVLYAEDNYFYPQDFGPFDL